MNQEVIDLFPEDKNRETEVSGFRFFSSNSHGDKIAIVTMA